MKKLLFIPCLLGLLLINGCQGNDQPASPSFWNTLGAITHADAAAGMLTAEALIPSGIEFANPLVYGGIVGVIAAAASANAGFQNRQIASNDGNIMLGSKYILAANPYEAIGIAHNKNLTTLLQLGRSVTAADLKNDNLVLSLINNYGTYTTTQQQQLLADYKTFDANNQVYEKGISNANLILSVNGDINKISFASSQAKNYISTFIAEVASMDKAGDYKDRLYNKVNRAIEALLIQEGTGNNAIIAYLTVYKHSYEYWN
jgi:hypothetical protein